MEGKKEEDREWCYWTKWWKRITASWRRELDIVVKRVIGRTMKAEHQEEDDTW